MFRQDLCGSFRWLTVAVALTVLSGCSALEKRAWMNKMIQARKSRDAAPALGAAAPNFKLKTHTTGNPREVELADFKGNRPVILIFGSYT